MQVLPEDGRKMHFIFLWTRIKFLFQLCKFSLSIIFFAYHFRFVKQKQMLSESIDPLHKPHNAPVPYPTMHQYIAKMCTILFLLQNHAFWVISLMHCGIFWDRSINSLFYSLTAFTNKKSWRNDSHFGFNKGFRLMTFYPEAVIKMPLWYVYSVWNSTMFSLCICI